MVEELLRLQTPTQGMWRTAAEDTELGGVTIKKGEMLLLLFTSANRDAKYFADPDTFNVERNFSAAHVAFSRGVHTCIGMMLARQELVCAFRQILKRMDNITLLDPSQRPTYEASLIFRGLETLDTLTNNGTLLLNGGTVTTGTGDADTSLTGAVTGTGFLVKNGTGAMRAYEHIRYGLAAGDQTARKAMRRQLMRYCELDTAAMVMVWKYWLG